MITQSLATGGYIGGAVALSTWGKFLRWAAEIVEHDHPIIDLISKIVQSVHLTSELENGDL